MLDTTLLQWLKRHQQELETMTWLSCQRESGGSY
jgi:hypothetical protein